MGGYIANFTVYTMAMAGLICFAVFVYKKVMDGSFRGSGSKYLSVEETMSLTPRKTLHVVRAGNEKFLIASDVDRTTLISKLGNSSTTSSVDFENIVQPQAPVYQVSRPVFEDYIQDTEIPVQKSEQQKRVHLAPVKSKAPHIVRGMDRRGGVNIVNDRGTSSTSVVVGENNTPQAGSQVVHIAGNSKTVELDFDTPKHHGFSTMKEMAKKINEL